MNTFISILFLVGTSIPVLYQAQTGALNLLDVLWIFFTQTVIVVLMKNLWLDRAFRQLRWEKHPTNNQPMATQQLLRTITAIVTYLCAAYFLYQVTLLQQINTLITNDPVHVTQIVNQASPSAFWQWLLDGLSHLLWQQWWVVVIMVIGQIITGWYQLTVMRQQHQLQTSQDIFLSFTSNILTSVSLPVTVVVVGYMLLFQQARTTESHVILTAVIVKTAMDIFAQWNPYSSYLKKYTLSSKPSTHTDLNN